MSPAEYARRNERRFVEDLRQFVRIPSVSSDPARKGDVRRCATWLAWHLRRVGVLSARVVEHGGDPLVLARILSSPDRPTLLVYGHFDVVPPGPREAWKHPPFAAEIAAGHIHGRGAADDKGQMLAHVKAIESFLATDGKPPCNLILLFEGGEEIGSPGVKPFLQRYSKSFEADGAIVSDTMMLGPGKPVLTTGLRGGLSMELHVCGPTADLHSGSFGGLVGNPLQALCEIVAKMHDSKGRVRIPEFYERVRTPRLTQRVPTEADLLQVARAGRSWGDRRFTAYERIASRPALTINGLSGGHQGHGGKSIIPASASAKFSFRLVPEQHPDEIEALTTDFLRQVCPSYVRWRLNRLSSSLPVRLDPRSPVIRAARVACRDVFGKYPATLPSGGSIPVVETFQTVLGIPTALIGFALRSDNQHGPNERFSLSRYAMAVQASIRLMEVFGRS